MTDILLIQPPIRDFYLTAKRTIPYGLACIASALLDEGFSVEILDCLATSKSRVVDFPPEMLYLKEYYGQPDLSPFALFHGFKHFGYGVERIAGEVRKSGAFLVGISSLFTAYSDDALMVAEATRQANPECSIVLGGHHATEMPCEVLRCNAVDFVIRGEGEYPMTMLALALKNGRGLQSIPGLVHRGSEGGGPETAPARLSDPDRFPPAMQSVNQQFYRRRKKGGWAVVASRGCPMTCTYCSVGANSRAGFKRRSVASVLREICEAVSVYDTGFIDFEDENLSFDRNWFLELLHSIKEHFPANGPELRAMNGLFPSTLDEEVVQTMKEAGFKSLNLALVTTSSRQLQRFRRPDVTEAFDHALDLATKYRLDAVGYIIVGAPSQSPQDSLSDLLYLSERRVLAGVSVYYPSPGSVEYERCREATILPASFSLMRSTALPISHKTTRDDSVTLLRLGRILNFAKSIVDCGEQLPEARALNAFELKNMEDRRQVGRLLLSWFLHDGIIRGITPDGEVYAHRTSLALSSKFSFSMKATPIRGTRV